VHNLGIKVLPTPKSAQETEEEAQDRKEKAAHDRNLVNATWVLAGIGVLQLIVFGAQAVMLKQTVEASVEQSDSMDRHIGEAARAASAMEQIAATIDKGNRAIMRAYISVTIGNALYQERRGPGQSDLKFEARPNIVNTGGTPARNVRIKSKADILPMPIPDDFAYPLPDDPAKPSFGGVLGAHQTNIIFGGIEDFVPDDEVASIKQGTNKALCIWGAVTYEDIFGDSHTAKFGQIITWLPNNNIFVYFITGQNDSD
jgi:hypothetical protein